MGIGEFYERALHWTQQAFELTPWARGGILIAAVVAALLAIPAARLLRSNPVIVGLLIAAVGCVLVFTLTPQVRIYGAAETCVYTITKPTRSDLIEPTDISLNLLMFLPIGVLIILLRPMWALFTALAIALLMPVALEYTQYAVARLGRTCSFYDVATNLLGLAIGVLIGLIVRLIWELIRWATRTPSA